MNCFKITKKRIIIAVIIFIPVFPIILPVLSPEQIIHKKEIFEKFNLTRREDGNIHNLPQDYADIPGWKELAGKQIKMPCRFIKNLN